MEENKRLFSSGTDEKVLPPAPAGLGGEAVRDCGSGPRARKVPDGENSFGLGSGKTGQREVAAGD